MTEREKMVLGQMYNPMDRELIEGRLNARKQLAALSSIPMNEEKNRKKILKSLFAETGKRFYIENPFICDYGSNIYWGENSFANFGCIILDCAPVRIGENVMIATGVQLLTATHPLEFKERNSGLEFAKPITIGDNVWIGGGVIVNPGVTIGNGSVIGSGSVVTRDVPENVLAAGNPCKVIKPIHN